MTEEIVEIPRHQPENPYGYTNLQLAERKKALKDMEKDYPHLPFGWLEMVYDYVYNEEPEKIKQIINEGKFETPGNYTLKNVKLTEKDEEFNNAI